MIVNVFKSILRKFLTPLALAVAPLALADSLDSFTTATNWPPSQAYATTTAETIDGASALRFDCNYASQADGAYCLWEKIFTQPPSLESANALRVRMKIDNAAALSGLSFSLHLPSLNEVGGTSQRYHSTWYSGFHEGWQTITIPFAVLAPDCYNQYCPPLLSYANLTRLKFVFWKKNGAQTESVFHVASAEAIRLPVALLKGDGEDYTGAVRSILQKYDIDFQEISQSALTGTVSSLLNPLRGTDVLIANNANVTASQASFLADNVTTNSLKVIDYGPQLLMLNGSLSQTKGGLASALDISFPSGSGVHLTNVTGISMPGTLPASMGLPTSMPSIYTEVWSAYYHDSSKTDTPAFAYWIDNGVATSTPAWLLNTKAAYRDKVLQYSYHPLDEDHLLLAVLLQLEPDLSEKIVDGAFAAADSFANYASFSAALYALDDTWQAAPISAMKINALQSVGDANTAYAAAMSDRTSGDATGAIGNLFVARKALGNAYAALNAPAGANEVKATWEPTGLGAYPGNWQESVDAAVANGFTHIITNVARGTSVAYPSQYRCADDVNGVHLAPTTITSDNFPCMESDRGWLAVKSVDADPLQSAVTAAHAAGLKLVVWKTVFSLIGSSADLSWWRSSAYTQREYNTSTNALDASAISISPCSQGARDRDYNIINEIASNYAVDGIQLDFIRFNSVYGSYDDYCKNGFAAYLLAQNNATDTGYATSCLESWPSKTARFASGYVPACATRYETYKYKVISDHVSDIRTLINSINANRPSTKPPVELVAAVWPVGNEVYAQDWPSWIDNGWLDGAFAMTYQASLDDFAGEVSAARAKVANPSGSGTKKPLYFGLAGYLATADGIVSQIEWLRTAYGAEAKGFSFFSFSADSIDNMLPHVCRAINYFDGDGDPCGHGLTATYFNDSDTDNDGVVSKLDDKLIAPAALTRIDSEISFNWGWGSPGAGVQSDNFSVRWTGKLKVPNYTGTYSFCVLGDDGIRLWVNGTQLLDFWKPQDSETHCASITLTAGQSVPIRLEFFDLTEEAIVKLSWSYPGQADTAIPSANFSPR